MPRDGQVPHDGRQHERDEGEGGDGPDVALVGLPPEVLEGDDPDEKAGGGAGDVGRVADRVGVAGHVHVVHVDHRVGQRHHQHDQYPAPRALHLPIQIVVI